VVRCRDNLASRRSPEDQLLAVDVQEDRDVAAAAVGIADDRDILGSEPLVEIAREPLDIDRRPGLGDGRFTVTSVVLAGGITILCTLPLIPSRPHSTNR
jgi:hypothetical protein